MTQVLVFSNPGEIDPRLVTTLGVNVKEGASPIGYFGTGLKYGLATILRGRGSVRMLSGRTELLFRTEEQVIRGRAFDMIVMQVTDPDGVTHDQELAFTLDLGRNWKPWMAYRELWSNAQDEGGTVRVVAEGAIPGPEPGHTHILVSGDAMLEAHARRHEWLLESAPIEAREGIEIHAGPGLGGFYHGIRVCDLPEPGQFTYNLLGQHSLTEDRTMDHWSFRAAVARELVTQIRDERVLGEVMLPRKGSFEEGIAWQHEWRKPSESFLLVAAQVREAHELQMPGGLLQFLNPHMPPEAPRPVALTRVEQVMLDRARAFLAGLGHEIRHPVVVVESLGHASIHGVARPERGRGEIWLPKALFGKGTKWVAGTLLEEHLHLTLELRDETRDMQNWLLDRVVSLGEELRGEPL